MKVIIQSIAVTAETGLYPAASIRDFEYMKEFIDNDTTPLIEEIGDFLGTPLELLTSYRGSLIHLAGGISFNRTHPSTLCANGYMSLPTRGCTERGRMTWKGRSYLISADFIV